MVASCEKEVVGFALVDTSCPSEALYSHFELRQLANMNQQQEVNQAAVIALFFMSPLFANCQRLFLREIMHQMSKTRLFLPVFQANDVSNALGDMILVPGRWHAFMHPPCIWAQVSPQASPSSRSSLRGSISTNSAASKIGQHVGFDCALFAMTHRLCSRHKTVVNSRIVVVGASQAAAACLSKLITCTNLKFSGLTLISPCGLRTLFDSGKALSDVELGPANAFQKTGINCLVNIISDTMIDLDRKAKLIHLSSGNRMQYDYLILATGLQDQTRSKIHGSPDKGVVRFEELSVMVNENTISFTSTDSPVVIYGLSLQTFCSIHLLLSKGIPGSLLVVVYPELEPLDAFAEKCFEDGFIAASVMKEVRAAGVIERSGFKLLEAIPGDGKDYLQGVGLEKVFRTSLNFPNQNENAGICIKQPCKLLVACTQPHVDHALFQAIRKEGLVFNGRIVVDGNFQTNDPSIFACGSVAKFSRQCGKQLNHESFNSCELGQTLAKSIIGLFTDHLPDPDKLWAGLLPDPFEAMPQASPIQSWPRTSIPKLIQAKGVGALLPGNFIYFHVTCPALQCQASKESPMQPLVVKKDDWLLKIELTKAREVRRIIYCGKVNLEAWKFVRLVGCHDPLMSNLFFGNNKAITNISNFFSQPWFTLIFHDKFLDFYTELCLDAYQILKDSPEEQSLVQEVVKDGFIMFMNAYKADFLELSIPSPWFSSKSEHSFRRSTKDASNNAMRHCKARTKKRDEIGEDFKEIQKDELCVLVEKRKEEAESVPSQKDTCETTAEQAGANLVIKQDSTTELVIKQDGTPEMLRKGEMELAVERIVEQKVKGQITAAKGVEEGKTLSEKELELLVGSIVDQIVKKEGMIKKSFDSKRNAESFEESSQREEVVHMVRQIMEKLDGGESRKEGVSRVSVKLGVIESEEAGVLVQKAQVKLLLVDGKSPRLISGVCDHSDTSKKLMLEEKFVSLRFIVDENQSRSELSECKKLVRVQFEYPPNDGNLRGRRRLPAVGENIVKLILNLGRENNVSATLITDTECGRASF